MNTSQNNFSNGTNDDWVSNLLEIVKALDVYPYEEALAKILVEKALENARQTSTPPGLSLAAAFDLIVAAEYYKAWVVAYSAYNKNARGRGTLPEPVYWLTNACGQPIPRPINWPTRKSEKGYESVSDAKSSVGMDRTDDIKKGIYQVLKIATAGKPKPSQITVKTALMSNIHAVRHYDEYLLELQDIVWTIDETGKAKKAGDLPVEKELYNLFDGIITFTHSYIRDEWIERNFQF